MGQLFNLRKECTASLPLLEIQRMINSLVAWKEHISGAVETLISFFAIVSDNTLFELHTCLQPSLFLFHYNEDYTFDFQGCWLWQSCAKPPLPLQSDSATTKTTNNSTTNRVFYPQHPTLPPHKTGVLWRIQVPSLQVPPLSLISTGALRSEHLSDLSREETSGGCELLNRRQYLHW